MCLSKGSDLRPIQASDVSSSKHDFVQYIRNSWWPEYDHKNEMLPNVLCMSCRLKLSKNNDNSELNPPSLPPRIMYENLVFKPSTRQNLKCSCEICLHGRFRWVELKEHGEFLVLPSPKNARKTTPKSPKAETRCKKCFQVIGKGRRHICNKTNKLQNLSGIVKSASIRTKSRVISGELTQAFSEAVRDKESNQLVVSLPTKGPNPLKIVNTATMNKVPVITHQDLINLQNKVNLSDRGIKTVAEAFRVKCGRKSVEPHLESELVRRNKLLASLFDSSIQDFKFKPNPSGDSENTNLPVPGPDGLIDIQKPVVHCKSARDVAEVLFLARNLEPEQVQIKCGLDFGQGSLKIVMIMQQRCPPTQQGSKRSKYSEGISAKANKDGSVKKTLLLGIVPGIQELHSNVQKILKLLEIEGLEFSYSSDIKMLYTLVGKSCSGSMKHGCPFCNSPQPYTAEGVLYRLGELLRHHHNFLEAGAVKSKAMKYSNVINEPLLTGNPEALVLDLLNIPELHLLIGIVSKLMKELEKCWPTKNTGRDWMDSYLKQQALARASYHGQQHLEGNKSLTFLKRLDSLECELLKV